MELKRKLNLRLSIMILLYNASICNSDNDTDRELANVRYTNITKLDSQYRNKSNTRHNSDLENAKRLELDILNETKELIFNFNTENKSDQTKTNTNRTKTNELTNQTQYQRLLPPEEMDNYDLFNFTEEPCVGDPEFCNMTKEEYLDMLNEYIFPQPYEWVLIATHAIVFSIGLVGNALVCIAVYRNHSMRTVTNYFIVNLAVADFMVILICLPPTVLWDVTETWFFGTAMCRIVLYFQVSVFG